MLQKFSELTDVAEQLSNSQFGTKISDLPNTKEEYKKILLMRYSALEHTSLSIMKKTMLSSPIIFSLLSEFAYRRRNIRVYLSANSKDGRFGKALYSDFLTHKSDYEFVFGMLSDERSRLLFLNLLSARMRCDLDIGLSMGAYIDKQQYNVQVMDECGSNFNFTEAGEVFVDCGASIGSTISNFLEWGLRPEKYFGFEPERNNFLILEKTIESIAGNNNFNIKQVGVSDDPGELKFDSGKGANSKIDKNGKGLISVVRLDDEISEPVTLIKMDIEGHEVPALEGAAGLIRKYKPKLAICIYHKTDDFRKIPMLIKKINPEYSRFYIRHHAYSCSNETVLYVC